MLAEYAHARFVQLVPNQQTFGHMHHWLKHDRWKHLAELPEGTSNLFTGDYCCAPHYPLNPSSALPYGRGMRQLGLQAVQCGTTQKICQTSSRPIMLLSPF